MNDANRQAFKYEFFAISLIENQKVMMLKFMHFAFVNIWPSDLFHCLMHGGLLIENQ